MNAKEYQALLRAAAEILGGAMHIVNADGVTILYNEEMAKLEKTSIQNVIGKPFREVFSNIPEEESTLMRALKDRTATRNQQQTYLNEYGKEITTVNTTVPIVVDGKVIAAMEVARDITDIKNMSDTILDLQSDLTAKRETAGKEDEGRDGVSGNDSKDADTKARRGEKREKRRGIRHYRFDDIIGENQKFEETIARAKKASHNDTAVLLYGETGVGKELFAQSIHYDGLRKDGPFLAQNCAAIPESLLEGMLFGTAKGGFTGAVDRAGLFEQANGGTLLLDEVSAMPIGLQGKLLRVLQEQYIRRVGGSKDIPIDVRIISTINEPAADLIERGALRQDLYYRLGTVKISIPALRERKDDIPILVRAFLKKYNERFGKEIWMLSDGAKDKVMNYDFPGNVRELENMIMSAVAMADEDHVITEEDIDIEGVYRESAEASGGHAAESFVETGGSLSDYLAGIEETVIRQYLTANDGNVSKTAKELGMLRQNLQHKIRKYGI